jgi:hypothetical protein
MNNPTELKPTIELLKREVKRLRYILKTENIIHNSEDAAYMQSVEESIKNYESNLSFLESLSLPKKEETRGASAAYVFVGDKATWYEPETGIAMIPMERAIELAEQYASQFSTPNKGLSEDEIYNMLSTLNDHCQNVSPDYGLPLYGIHLKAITEIVKAFVAPQEVQQQKGLGHE